MMKGVLAQLAAALIIGVVVRITTAIAIGAGTLSLFSNSESFTRGAWLVLGLAAVLSPLVATALSLPLIRYAGSKFIPTVAGAYLGAAAGLGSAWLLNRLDPDYPIWALLTALPILGIGAGAGAFLGASFRGHVAV